MLSLPRRVGPVDSVVRFVLGVALIGLAAYLFGTLPSDWKLSLVHLLILGGYLLGTAVAGIDPVYNAMDVSTSREWRRHHPSR